MGWGWLRVPDSCGDRFLGGPRRVRRSSDAVVGASSGHRLAGDDDPCGGASSRCVLAGHQLCSAWRYDFDPQRQGGFGLAIVVGDQSFEVVSELQRRRDVDGIKSSERNRTEAPGMLEICRLNF